MFVNNVSDSSRLLAWWASLKADASISDTPEFTNAVSQYESLKSVAFDLPVRAKDTVDVSKFNPLSKVTAGNPWSTQFDNQNRLAEIRLDVDRTFQDMETFCREKVKQSLVNVLFVFSKSEDIRYRQGMNELCAILYYVVSQGLEAHIPVTDSSIEGVTFSLLSSLLKRVGFAALFFPASSSLVNADTCLISRCDRVFDLLSNLDPRLHRHLVTNEILPNLFLLRWIRVLFSREFSFTNTLRVWDYILANLDSDSPLKFPCVVDHVALAMILNIRQTLLSSDSSGCFDSLLRYTAAIDIDQLLHLATQLASGKPFTLAPLPVAAPVQSVMESTSPGNVQSRRDKVVSDLSSVIDSLRGSEAAQLIQREIVKLENIVAFLKPLGSK